MRAPRLLCLAALAGTAARAHDYQVCAPPGLPPAAKNASVAVTVQSNTSVAPFLCTSAAPGGCAPGAPALHACGFVLAGGATSYVTVAADVATVAFVWMATQPFSWHALSRPAPVQVAWPTGAVSLGAPGTLYCDADADCPAGVACVAASGACAALVPSASASPAPPAPVPSPTAGPAAARCNLTGTWLQSPLAAEHSADATIDIVSGAQGAFTFACKKGRGTCPGGLPALDGTGVLSPHDNSLVLTPAAGSGVGAIGGLINNTLPCGGGSQPAGLALLTGGGGGAVEWAREATPRPPVLDTTVSVATFLGAPGGGGGGGGQFVSSGVAILSAGGGAGGGAHAVLVAAGNGGATFGALTPVALFGASPDANGTLVVLAFSADGGLTPTGVVKLGARVDHVRANARGDVAVAGSFGVAVLTGLSGPGAPAVAWHDDLARVQPGPCGVCCSAPAATCRVDIGDDGVVAVDYRVQSAEGWLWGAYDAAGAPLAQQAIEGADITAVVVDDARRQVMVATFRDDNTGREPMVMPRVEAFSYAAAARLAQTWVDFPWSARVYRTPGPCDGNVADGRVMALRLGRDGTLLLGGRSDGGNSPYFCGLRNATRVTPFSQIDGFTSGYNMAAQAVTNFVRVDPSTGEAIVGQLQLARLPSSGKGNTLLTLAAQSDAGGNVYLLQMAACCIADMANLTVNGQPTAPNVDATVLQVLDASLSRRAHWTHFVAPGGSGGGGAPVDVDVRGGLVALAMTTAAEMVTVRPLPGTGAAAAGGAPVGFLVVLPTLEAAAAAAAAARSL